MAKAVSIPAQNELTKVSMNLTKRDMENLEYVTSRLHARQQVTAISRSMELCRTLLEAIDQGDRILLKGEDGNLREVQILW